ncbi:DUF899 family protein [Streptomyces sp. SID13031]|uniref:DUF899 family protein n=1 Tax=Streptomyces sp. SID13031 TaxID=2706046 RepID=UPI0013C8E6F4|nr:DUF899 family protein [Streptomyces sp. SID13031]NEA31238.1 DUF899 domain-containing protein [Streptomyces sp. SID13031]
MPPVTSTEDWATARALLLVEEKQATHTLDALAAKCRRLPMTRLEKSYILHGPEGDVSLTELFDGRRQLIVYHFMYGANWTDTCGGCSRRMDDVGRLDHLHARDTSFVAAAPYPKIVDLWTRKGWTVPVYSSHGSSFNTDMGVTLNGEENRSRTNRSSDSGSLPYRQADLLEGSIRVSEGDLRPQPASLVRNEGRTTDTGWSLEGGRLIYSTITDRGRIGSEPQLDRTNRTHPGIRG